ncbi:hypothetical protein EON65_03775 [archaeon]|nr:MAG: hypothetical protein EON65_03775 [archaeon]
MSINDTSVVDEHFSVRGVGGVKVCDASVLPTPTLGSPLATVQALAVLAVEEILENE